MNLIYVTVAFICSLISCSQQEQTAMAGFPLGIELGRPYITAAQFSKQDDSQPVTVAKVLGNRAYQAYFAEAFADVGKRKQFQGKWMVENRQGILIPAPPDTYDGDQARQIFVEALHTIQDAASNALGSDATINVLTIPNYFNHSSTMSVYEAAEEAGLPIQHPWQIIRWPNAGRLAYGLDSCRGFGLDKEECNFDDGVHEVVYVDYQADALELKFASVTEHSALVEHQTRNSLAESGNNHLSTIRNALTAFTQSAVFVNNEPRFGRFDFLRGIIVSGEIPQPRMEELRKLLVEAFPGQESKILNSIDPLYVGAAGAAYRARHSVLDPARFEEKAMDSGHGPPDHDEI